MFEGRVLTRVELGSLSALKTYDPPLERLLGQRVCGSSRRGKFLVVRLGEMYLVAHLARSGWVRFYQQLPEARARPGRGPLALRLGVDTGAGADFTEQASEKRLAIWVAADLAQVEPLARLGVDPLDPAFDPTLLGRVLASRPGQLKGLLTDQTLLAGVGNAYSDEALHRARLSPYARPGSLSSEAVSRLHRALVEVLSEALESARSSDAHGLKAEKRAGMRVHGRTGQPCADCGDTIREVAFATRSFQYCPTCQTGGKVLADRRLSRLLK